MTSVQKSGTFTLGGRTVNRVGYGAMQLAGPGVFGPPKDHDGALAVLREAVGQGVNHIDTSDFYGRTSPTGLSARRCTYTQTISPSSQKLAHGAAPMDRGFRPCHRMN